MRYVPTVNDHNLKGGMIVSVVLHGLMFFFLLFELPKIVPPLPPHRGPIPFDIVTIGEITNTRIGSGEPKPSAPPAVAPAPAPAPAPQPKEAAPPEPPQKMASKQAADDAEAFEALKPKPKTKPKPPAPKPAAQPDLFGSVLRDVAKMKPTPRAPSIDGAAEKGASGVGAAVGGSGTSVGFGPSLSSRLTITEEDALRRQIEQCWNPPVGARDAENLIVEVIIDVNPDRTVLNTDIVDKGRYARDPFFRAAADAAVRALRNPRCTPLELDPEKYEQWKRIDFTFDPRDML
ncbi:MAG: hypothetical protein PHE27_03165 [Alphaproteobacteria bacterium]|nr:hypothetical protein [Alphaproteobacteria bacterium]